jgi:hypothetical protein
MTRQEKIDGLAVLAKSFIGEEGTPKHRLGRGFMWLLKEYRGQQKRVLELRRELAMQEYLNDDKKEVEEEETVQ